MKNIELTYNENVIRFIVGKNDQIKVNGNDMARIFDKDVQTFCKNRSTVEFMNAYLSDENLNNLIPIKREDLIFNKPNFSVQFNHIFALKYASVLDSNFEIWMIRTIEDLKFQHYKAHLQALNAQQEERLHFEKLKARAAKEQNDLAILIIESHIRLEQFKNDKISALKKKSKQVHNNLFTAEADVN